MVRIRLANNSSIVWIDIVHCSRGVEEGVTIDPKGVSMDFVCSGLKLILGDTLTQAILRGEGAL